MIEILATYCKLLSLLSREADFVKGWITAFLYPMEQGHSPCSIGKSILGLVFNTQNNTQNNTQKSDHTLGY
jgi:hypothetical protein